ncbi:hypothetical protein GCM10011391_10530 [Pullulanibacillus camelliae]|uniref:Luciferase-like domain-containing protein n=1 Tax=Pullulanibacillus camelliae TaxID=1707096 RepID=A0A8J2YDE8_9BACL|nr:LLM class flavin-dependent oxidoreductase [Pullulanibacillus camelliae]GGE33719.1 hypothetical protein GCM10011391_10530 [Pullulanibacillus camelliae]
MKLSILDQSPVMEKSSAKTALEASVALAQEGERLGYHRYWIAEHHDIAGLACPAPEVMLAYIGARTERIRLGSGAVLLPHYKPYKVAETFNLLATLFPGRIDLGIGRAPGGSAEASIALSGNFLENVRQMPQLLETLIHFFQNDFPEDEMFSKIKASPQPPIHPQLWLLGTSEKSGLLAAEKGLAYAFGHFMSDNNGPKAIADYQQAFQSRGAVLKSPCALVAASVICAETTEEAEALALRGGVRQILRERGEAVHDYPTLEDARSFLMTTEERAQFAERKKRLIIGNPKEVKEQLYALQHLYGTDEIMIVTLTPTYVERQRSYQFIAKEML